MIIDEDRIKKALKRVAGEFDNIDIKVDLDEILLDMCREHESVKEDLRTAESENESLPDEVDVVDHDGVLPLLADVYYALKSMNEPALMSRVIKVLRNNGEFVC